MKNLRLLIILLLFSNVAFAQRLPVRWDELLASDWEEALDKSGRTCILPIGILEKHGLHAPLGSDTKTLEIQKEYFERVDKLLEK